MALKIIHKKKIQIPTFVLLFEWELAFGIKIFCTKLL